MTEILKRKWGSREKEGWHGEKGVHGSKTHGYVERKDHGSRVRGEVPRGDIGPGRSNPTKREREGTR